MAKQSITELKAEISRLKRANENLNENIQQGLELLNMACIHSVTPANVERLIELSMEVFERRA